MQTWLHNSVRPVARRQAPLRDWTRPIEDRPSVKKRVLSVVDDGLFLTIDYKVRCMWSGDVVGIGVVLSMCCPYSYQKTLTNYVTSKYVLEKRYTWTRDSVFSLGIHLYPKKIIHLRTETVRVSFSIAITTKSDLCHLSLLLSLHGYLIKAQTRPSTQVQCATVDLPFPSHAPGPRRTRAYPENWEYERLKWFGIRIKGF